MAHDEERNGNTAARKRTRDGIRALLMLGVGAGLVAVFFAFPWFDTLDQRWVSCEVVEARPFQGDNTSMQPWKVQIETTDCRDVIYSEGVTEENVQQIAESLEPGTYELKLSWVSRRLADGWLPTMAPSAKDYRPVD